VAVETGLVFKVMVTKTDGSVLTFWYRSDGESWQGKPTTTGFVPAD
jgi:hypothetical protein